MVIGRGQMGKQIATTRSSKGGAKKMAFGGLAAISPAAALVKSLQSGSPEGLMKMLPLGAAIGAAASKGRPTAADKAKAATAAKPTAMKKGGSIKSGRKS